MTVTYEMRLNIGFLIYSCSRNIHEKHLGNKGCGLLDMKAVTEVKVFFINDLFVGSKLSLSNFNFNFKRLYMFLYIVYYNIIITSFRIMKFCLTA